MIYFNFLSATDLVYFTDFENKSGLTIDGSGIAVSQETSTNTNFLLEKISEDLYRLKDPINKRYLSVKKGEKIVGSSKKSDSHFEEFKIEKKEDKTFTLKNVGTEMCLTHRGFHTHYYALKCKNSNSQRFHLLKLINKDILLKDPYSESYFSMGAKGMVLVDVFSATIFDLVKFSSGKVGFRIKDSEFFIGNKKDKVKFSKPFELSLIEITLEDKDNETKVIKLNNKCLSRNSDKSVNLKDCSNTDLNLRWTIVENVIEEDEENELSAVSEPVVSEPAVSEPVVSEPVVSEPVVSEPVVSEPVVSEPVVSEPVVSESVVSEPVVSEPVLRKEYNNDNSISFKKKRDIRKIVKRTTKSSKIDINKINSH